MTLTSTSLVSGYGKVQIVHGIDLEVPDNGIVVILGANGAGKSTLLKTLSGHLPVLAGDRTVDGTSYRRHDAVWAARNGIVLVPQTAAVFSELSVIENLRLGAMRQKRPADAVTEMTTAFPILGERQRQPASTLSGGERQMLAISSALLMQPKYLLLDEPTTGLSPLVAEQTAQLIDHAVERGLGVAWVVEQMPELALTRASEAYFIEAGQVTHRGPAQDLLNPAALKRLMLNA